MGVLSVSTGLPWQMPPGRIQNALNELRETLDET